MNIKFPRLSNLLKWHEQTATKNLLLKKPCSELRIKTYLKNVAYEKLK